MRKLMLISACANGFLATLPPTARADVVAAGTDYFYTWPDTSDNITGLGVVNFMGVGFGPGGTDTIVQRLSDATINGPAIPTQIIGLQLVSTNLPTPVYVSLDPINLANDTGSMTIGGNTTGGTFTSTLNVFFDVCTTPGVNGVGCGVGSELGTGSLTFGPDTNDWSSTPLPAEPLISGPVGDQAANMHTGLAAGEVDFYPGVSDTLGTPVPKVVSEQTLLAAHMVDPVPAPEPTTVTVLGAALAGLAGMRRGRRRHSAPNHS